MIVSLLTVLSRSWLDYYHSVIIGVDCNCPLCDTGPGDTQVFQPKSIVIKFPAKLGW